MEPKWLKWGRRLQALAQNGLAYCTAPFDIERYEEMREIASEIIASETQSDPAATVRLFETEEGYATPKVDTRAVIFDEQGRLLLVQEALDEYRWTLPGGWADTTDTPSEAVEREVREETGYEARASKLLMLLDRNLHGHPAYYFRIYKLFFRCQITGGAPKESIETGASGFFARDQLPELSISRVTPEEIERIFYHYDHPDLPTDFD